MNPMDFCTQVEDGNFDYEVDSSAMYPAMIALLRDLCSGTASETAKAGMATITRLDGERRAREMAKWVGESGSEFHIPGPGEGPPPNPIFELILPDAKKLPQAAWEMALQPMTDETGAFLLPGENRMVRAAALECARKLFTELLHQMTGGGPMSIRLSKDVTYRIRE